MRRFHFIQILWLFTASVLSAVEPGSITFCCYNLKNYLGMERTHPNECRAGESQHFRHL